MIGFARRCFTQHEEIVAPSTEICCCECDANRLVNPVTRTCVDSEVPKCCQRLNEMYRRHCGVGKLAQYTGKTFLWLRAETEPFMSNSHHSVFSLNTTFGVHNILFCGFVVCSIPSSSVSSAFHLGVSVLEEVHQSEFTLRLGMTS